MTPKVDGDLAFSFHTTRAGRITITRDGRAVAVLRGASAQRFLAKANGATFAAQQQLMARATGNYKRGNERPAAERIGNEDASDAQPCGSTGRAGSCLLLG